MYSLKRIHESRKLKQARPLGRVVDLLCCCTLATPSRGFCLEGILTSDFYFVKEFYLNFT